MVSIDWRYAAVVFFAVTLKNAPCTGFKACNHRLSATSACPLLLTGICSDGKRGEIIAVPTKANLWDCRSDIFTDLQKSLMPNQRQSSLLPVLCLIGNGCSF